MVTGDAKFTIFLPVRNGGEYLCLCVESILAQSYKHFDLVILENKSTDGSAEWLQHLAERDQRIKVIPSDESLSIEENWKRILSVPKNEFMTMIGHDDLFDVGFLEEINKTIVSNPEANLYLTHFRLIDSEGRLIRHCAPMPRSETAADFLAARMANIRDSFGTGYVMRSKQYDSVGGIPAYPKLLFADDALWIKLIDSGFKVTSSQVCFSYRLHGGSTSGAPNSDALFYGLKQYLLFLRTLAKQKAELGVVINRYGTRYVAMRCQDYYYALLKNTPWGKPVDAQAVAEVKNLLKEYASETTLDEACVGYGRKIRIKYWLSFIIKRISGMA